MLNEPTIKELVEWIWTNKGNKVFRDITKEELFCCVLAGIEEKTLIYSTDNNKKLVGVICAVAKHEKKELFIWNILALQKYCFINLFLTLNNMWPSYEIYAERKGKIVKYNLQTIRNKFTQQLQ